MDLRQLRYFAQIVESGSLSKASRQLYIAQPALSQQVSKLEEEVGRPLLNRSSRGVAPTENGLALYHHARFMLRQLEQALSIARQESGAVQGMVSVGLPATTVAALGLPLVRRIRERYPNVMLNVVEGMSGHLGQMMRLGQLDLAVLFASDVAFDLSVEPLLEEELFVILPKASPLVAPRRTSISIEEAAALPLILPTGTHGLRRRIAIRPRNISAISAVAASARLYLCGASRALPMKSAISSDRCFSRASSALGTPSMCMMTSAGSGPAKSAMKSNSSRSSRESSRKAVIASTCGRRAWMERVLKTWAVSCRSRVCSGGSRNTIHRVR